MSGNPIASFISPFLGAQATSTANAEAALAKSQANNADANSNEVAMVAMIRINRLNNELFEAKKAVHGQVALRDALIQALAEVAPQHPLASEADARRQIRVDAEAKTKPEDPWFP